MRSKTYLFSRTLFLDILKRFWPLFAAYPLAWIFMIPVELNSSLKAALSSPDSPPAQLLNPVLREIAAESVRTCMEFAPMAAAFFAIAFAMASFYGLYTSRSVSALCSMPIKREGLFLSAFLPGPVVMLASNVLAVIITLIVLAGYGIAGGCVPYLLTWLGAVTLEEIFFLGLAALCGAMTGHILVLPAVYIVLNFTWTVVFFASSLVVNNLLFGLSEHFGMVAYIFSPLIYMVAQGIDIHNNTEGYFVTMEYDGWGYIAVCALAGLLLILAAMRLVKIRRMEAAGDVVAFKPLKPLFKYCMTFGSALVIGLWLLYSITDTGFTNAMHEGLFVLLACMLAGALIGYFTAEMLIKKNFRVFSLPNWKGLAVSWAVIIALVLFVDFDLLGIEKRVPEAGDVESVVVNGNFQPFSTDDPELIEQITGIHSSIVENKELHENSSGAVTWLDIDYYFKDGGGLSRYYSIADGSAEVEALEDFLNSPKVTELRLLYDLGSDEDRDWTVNGGHVLYYTTESGEQVEKVLNSEQAKHIYEDGILPDMREGNIEQVDLNPTGTGSDYDSTHLACDLDISFISYPKSSGKDGKAEAEYAGLSTWPMTSSVHTLAVLKELGIEPVTYKEYNESIGKAEPSDKPAAVATEIAGLSAGPTQ